MSANDKAELLAIKEKLRFQLNDLNAACGQELFNAAKVLAQEVAHQCHQIALLKERHEQERGWAPIPMIHKINNMKVSFL